MIFDNLPSLPEDPILKMIGEFQADPRAEKIDLGVGVYKDDQGRTPILAAVKEAERRLLEGQETKTYVGPLGDVVFSAEMAKLALGAPPMDRLALIQTPGGCGALWILMGLAKRARPDVTLWMPRPTWVNHPAIASAYGLPQRSYAYFDAATGNVDFDALRDDLKRAGPGDMVLLHGCCHNPTGANLTLEQWEDLADMAAAQGWLPLIDLAYQGFGDGLEADAAGARAMATKVPELLVAVSCSKNFALYRERTGCAMALLSSPAHLDGAMGALKQPTRTSISMPPDHGAAVVRTILTDPALRAGWEAELTAMRTRMNGLRDGLAEALRARANDDRFDFIARHRGMFSLLGATPEQAQAMRDRHGIYIVGDGRANIAGLRADALDRVAAAMIEVGL